MFDLDVPFSSEQHARYAMLSTAEKAFCFLIRHSLERKITWEMLAKQFEIPVIAIARWSKGEALPSKNLQVQVVQWLVEAESAQRPCAQIIDLASRAKLMRQIAAAGNIERTPPERPEAKARTSGHGVLRAGTIELHSTSASDQDPLLER